MNTRQIQRFRNLIKTMAELRTPIDMSRVHICGTPSCALGHYAAREDMQTTFYLGGLQGLRAARASPYCSIHFNDSLVLNEFGITSEDAEFLFGPVDEHGEARVVTPSEVVEYLTKFFAGRHTGAL